MSTSAEVPLTELTFSGDTNYGCEGGRGDGLRRKRARLFGFLVGFACTSTSTFILLVPVVFVILGLYFSTYIIGAELLGV